MKNDESQEQTAIRNMRDAERNRRDAERAVRVRAHQAKVEREFSLVRNELLLLKNEDIYRAMIKSSTSLAAIEFTVRADRQYTLDDQQLCRRFLTEYATRKLQEVEAIKQKYEAAAAYEEGKTNA